MSRMEGNLEIQPKIVDENEDLFRRLESELNDIQDGETTNKEFLVFLSQLPVWERPKESYKILELLTQRFRDKRTSPFLRGKKEEPQEVILYAGSRTMEQKVDADEYFDSMNGPPFFVGLLDLLQNKILREVLISSANGVELQVGEDHERVISKIFKELSDFFLAYNKLYEPTDASYGDLLKTEGCGRFSARIEAGLSELMVAISLIGKCKNEGLEEDVIKVIGAAPGFYFTVVGAGSLSKINPERSASLLLKKLHGDCPDYLKRKYARTLYHLELGRIGVDKGVVDYLERKYVLEGGNKDLASFAQRISGDGKIGVFDNEGNMLGYIEMGDLTDKEKIKSAQILDLSRDLLFTDPNTPDEIRQQFMQGYSRFYTQVFFQETGVYFNNLSLRAQLWFYEYIKQAKPVEREKALTLAKNFGEDGIKTFIALEQDGKVGEAIFNIAEGEIGQSTKTKIFKVYAGLVDTAENLRKYLLSNFKSLVFNETTINKMVGSLLLKAGALVADFADSTESLRGKNSEEANLQLLEKLDEINVKIIVFADVLKYLPHEEVANLDLKEVPAIQTIEDISGGDLSKRKDLVEKMKAIIKKQFPAGDEELFEQELLTESGLSFTISLIGGEILSFFAKKKMGEKLDYIDWFISNPDAPVRGLGEATIKLGLDSGKSKNHSYYAVAKPHVKSFPIFIEGLGFSAFAGSTADGEYKHHYVRISRLPDDNKLAAKLMPPEKRTEFKKAVSDVCLESNKVSSLIFDGRNFSVCKVEFDKNVNSHDDFTKDDANGWIMAEIERQSLKGNILTSYIPETTKKNNRIFYAVFENDINVEKREVVTEALLKAA